MSLPRAAQLSARLSPLAAPSARAAGAARATRAASAAAAAAAAPAPRHAAKPSRQTRRRAPAALQVSDAAAARIRELLSGQSPPPAGVRIGVRTRGCNGMAYTLNYAHEKSKFDEKVEIDGADVYIDPRALMHIVGTRMDFVDNDLVAEFVFDNPNAKGTCGCGESFNV